MQKNELVFKDIDNSLVIIMPDVLSELLAQRQLTAHSKEAAGVLIGERRGPHLVIRCISLPALEDIRSRFSVNRVSKHHQDLVNTKFLESEGILQYLGEWHTHPEDYPTPSITDISSWNKNLNIQTAFLLIIVGRCELWVGKKESLRLTRLEQLGFVAQRFYNYMILKVLIIF